MVSKEYKKLFNFIKEVGQFQMSYYRKQNFKLEKKSNIFDWVTEVDKKSEEMVGNFLADNFPRDAILGEEYGQKKAKSENQGKANRTWIIDPIDGTNNFIAGLPMYTISVGLECSEGQHAGFVYAPAVDEFFWGEKGKGSFLNGNPLQIKKLVDLEQSIWATGFPYDKREHPLNNVDFCANMILKLRDIRRMGAASYDICLVALGVLDGYWELNLQKWDIWAGKTILEEAGGVMDFLPIERRQSFICGHPTNVAKMREAFLDFYQLR